MDEERTIRCARCQVSVSLDDIKDHISQAHGSEPIPWTTKSVSNASPPVTGAPYWDWEEYERELTED